MEIPAEYIYRSGASEVSRYFQELIMGKMMNRKVAILVKDYTESLFFVECDDHGYPKMRYIQYLSYWDMTLKLVPEGIDPCIDQCRMTRKEIRVDSPMILFNTGYDYRERPYVFMWSGEVITQKEMSVDELDVKQLLQLAQAAVKSREGLIINEVAKNRQI